MSLYDPNDPSYLDPTAARAERDRTFQVCSDCRICVRLCPSFRSLFEMIDANEDGAHDVKVLKDKEHDRVVSECYQCKLCYVVCPYTPERQQEWVIDFPRLMLRSLAIQHVQAKVPAERSVARAHRPAGQGRDHVRAGGQPHEPGRRRPQRDGEGHRHRQGAAASRRSPRCGSRSGSAAVEAAPPVEPRATVTLFPTCLVEYQDPSIGKALVGVYERNRVACELPEGQVCCGMPWLDAGDVDKFREAAEHNVAVLAPQVRAGKDIVVPQPTCAYVLKNEYADFLEHRRRQARRRAHLRHVGVPARAPPRGAARHRLRRHHVRIDPLAGGVPLPRAADRAQEQAAHGAHRRQGQHGGALLGDRRHVGAAGREPRDGEAGREAADGEGPRVHRRPRRRRLSPGEHRDQGRHRHDAVASPAGDGARATGSSTSEEADRRRHRRPPRLREGARRVPLRTSST